MEVLQLLEERLKEWVEEGRLDGEDEAPVPMVYVELAGVKGTLREQTLTGRSEEEDHLEVPVDGVG